MREELQRARVSLDDLMNGRVLQLELRDGARLSDERLFWPHEREFESLRVAHAAGLGHESAQVGEGVSQVEAAHHRLGAAVKHELKLRAAIRRRQRK